MKKLLIIFCAAFSVAANAQLKEGRIVYERTVQMAMRMNANLPPEIASQIPKSRTDQFELLFSGNQTLWQFLPNANEESNTFSSGNAVVQFRGGGPTETVFTNLEKGTSVSQREVMDRSFIVSDSIQKLNWKLTDETKTILNYTVRKAVAQRIGTRQQMSMENGQMKRTEIPDTSNIIAWFTTDIPVSAAPPLYQGQLPGAILELDVNKGQNIVKAVEVSPKVKVASIKEPKDGKKVTAAEFRKESDALLEQMRKNMGGNGVNIRTVN